ncbi:unnamed protein product [Staurois parvus]|uniref:Uncharacterized protein n=1 Tax=Staurois parvus TaxID=386267 RepID=A0ABN9ERH5_9NEOB|nr:unnamed protein product [Staurois parvus]
MTAPRVISLQVSGFRCFYQYQGRTDHLATLALPEGPGSVGGPMRCPWYLSLAFS